MSTGGSKRAVAEIRFGEDRAGVAKVGGRSIYQYWTLLSPHFRDVFLAPQRRSDDGGVSWTWREPAEKSPPTAADLAGVRSRLERAQESFVENPVSTLMSETRSGGASSQEIIDQLTARVKSVADGLASLPDAALAEFVCRTENDVMVHSWGLAASAKIMYPDSLESGVGGVVMFGGKGSTGNEVVIENAKGLRVARTVTDEAGEFAFTKLAPGRYRVRVVTGPGEFSEKGVTATVERGQMSRIELRSTSDPEAPASEGGGENLTSDTTATNAPVAEKKRRRTIWLILLVLLVLSGGGWLLFRYFDGKDSGAPTAQRISTLTPEDFSQSKPAARKDAGAPGRASAAGAAAAAESPAGDPVSLPRPASGISGAAAGVDDFRSTVSKIGTRVELAGAPSRTVTATATSSNVGASRTGTEPSGASSVSAESAAAMEAPGAKVAPSGAQKEDSSGERALTSRDTKAAGAAKSEALQGHLSGGVGGAMPETPPGEDPPKVGNLGEITGSAKEGKGASAGVGAKPAGGTVKSGGQSGAPASGTDGSQAGAAGPVAKSAAAQAPVAAVTVVEKPAEKSAPVARAKNEQKDEQEKTDNLQAAPKEDRQPELDSAKPERAKSGSTGGNVSDVAGSGDSSTESAASATSAGESAATGLSATTPSESARPTPAVPAVSREPLPTKPLPAGMQAMGILRVGSWRLCAGRDAIVPTQPVLEGEPDAAEAVRRAMLEETKALLPVTLRRPALQAGLVLKFASGVKVQPLRWVEERRGVANYRLSAPRGETGWAVSAPPRNVRLTLVQANGVEVARVEFDHEGIARVFVRPEMRAVIWLGAKYADAENANDANLPRMGWQVLRGPLAASAWTNDSRWLDGTACRLEMVMNGANPAGTRIALVDQASGWLLASELE